MASETASSAAQEHELSREKPNWQRWRDIPLAIIGWLVVVGIVFWLASHVAGTILVIIIAALLAFALSPLVNVLGRFIPRIIALAIVYVVFFGLLGVIIYFVVHTAVDQLVGLAQQVETWLTVAPGQQTSPLYQLAAQLGISSDQIAQFRAQLVSQAQAAAGDVLPIISSVAGVVIDLVVVTVLSIYFAANGPRIGRWFRTGLPLAYRARANFGMDTLNRVVGGYIRGQVTLSALIGVLVGVGMFAMQIPFAILLGVVAFVFEFIPFLGVIFSGAACVLLALTKGPGWAVAVLVYFVFVHVIEGDVVGPRIVGQAVGLHPAVSLIALIAGDELFGLWGALFAAPLAGLLQALIIAIWQSWQADHPEQFPTGHSVTDDIAVVPVVSPQPKTLIAPIEAVRPADPGSALPSTPTTTQNIKPVSAPASNLTAATQDGLDGTSAAPASPDLA